VQGIEFLYTIPPNDFGWLRKLLWAKFMNEDLIQLGDKISLPWFHVLPLGIAIVVEVIVFQVLALDGCELAVHRIKEA